MRFWRALVLIGSVCALLCTLWLMAERRAMPQSPFLVFVSHRDGTPELYRIRPDGRTPQRLTHSPWRESYPVYTPDMRYIIYAIDDGRRSGQLARVRSAGGTPERLPASRPDQRYESLAATIHNDRLLYLATRGSRRGVYTSNLDGSDQRALIERDTGDVIFRNPAWAPDGRAIYFAATGLTHPPQLGLLLYRLPLDVPNPQPDLLSPDTNAMFNAPAPAPDGQRLAFVTGAYNTARLWALTADTGRPQPIADLNPGFEPRVAWSPGGDALTFFSTLKLANYDIFAWGAADGRLRQVTRSPASDIDPAWAPPAEKSFAAARVLAGLLLVNFLGIGWQQARQFGL
ncbi:MAG: TolB family protein [Anaerolineales bacterium]